MARRKKYASDIEWAFRLGEAWARKCTVRIRLQHGRETKERHRLSVHRRIRTRALVPELGDRVGKPTAAPVERMGDCGKLSGRHCCLPRHRRRAGVERTRPRVHSELRA